MAEDCQNETQYRACSWTDMQSGRPPGCSKSPKLIEKLTEMPCSSVQWIVGLDDLKDRVVHLFGQPRPTTHQQSRWSVTTSIKSSSSSSPRAHEQLFSWLSVVVCCCYLDIGITIYCSCVLPLWHNDVRVLWLGCNFFSASCWHSNLVWASIYAGHNFSPHGMLFVNVNKYSSTINRRI